MGLTEQTCEPCRGGMPALEHDAIVAFQKELSGWNVIDEHHLVKDWEFDDFAGALAFTNKIGALAEAEGHLPVAEREDAARLHRRRGGHRLAALSALGAAPACGAG